MLTVTEPLDSTVDISKFKIQSFSNIVFAPWNLINSYCLRQIFKSPASLGEHA